ncbi:MAG: hypothetical protein ACI81R_000193 [Bradymonadia bacterium]|jgi:hypothetical protein
MNPLRVALLALLLGATTSGCDRFDGVEFIVNSDLPLTTYSITRTTVEVPVGVAIGVRVRPKGGDDPARLQLRSSDDVILRIEDGPGDIQYFVGVNPGETRLEVVYRGTVEDRIDVVVFEQ